MANRNKAMKTLRNTVSITALLVSTSIYAAPEFSAVGAAGVPYTSSYAEAHMHYAPAYALPSATGFDALGSVTSSQASADAAYNLEDGISSRVDSALRSYQDSQTARFEGAAARPVAIIKADDVDIDELQLAVEMAGTADEIAASMEEKAPVIAAEPISAQPVVVPSALTAELDAAELESGIETTARYVDVAPTVETVTNVTTEEATNVVRSASAMHGRTKLIPVISREEAVITDDIFNIMPANSGAVAPFDILIDGELVTEGVVVEAARAKGFVLVQDDVDVTVDNLRADRFLNVSASQDVIYTPHLRQTIDFKPHWNYSAFINRSEVRVFDGKTSTQKDPIITLPVKEKEGDLLASWEFNPWEFLRNTDKSELKYVLRTYDSKGRFDETFPQSLEILRRQKPTNDTATTAEKVMEGHGINQLRLQHIPVNGGLVTLNAYGLPAEHAVRYQGKVVPVDGSGNFVMEEILPVGMDAFDFTIIGKNGQETRVSRSVEIKENDVFYIALGDLTLGENNFSGPAYIQSAKKDEFEDRYLHGRAAFYVKGKVKGDYHITAMADTGEDDIDEIFKQLDDKDPRSLVRRLDSDYYYPEYGDDSTTRETAPTQGKFYLRVDKDKSYGMWGNYQTDMKYTDMAHIDRSLYGGKLRYNSNNMTSFGESRTEATVFAAEPNTFAKRDDFRGTGGSVYFLEFQDITLGSEKVRVEVRDANSGIVTYSRDLVYGEDYDIDYIKGRILLHEPLTSTVDDQSIVESSAAGFGDPVFLVTNYEVTPTNSNFFDDNYTVGGTVQQWIGDHVKVGVTGLKEHNDGEQDRDLYGANAVVRYKPGTFIRGEYTITEGPSKTELSSLDGGYSFNQSSIASTGSDDAAGLHIEAVADFKEIGLGEEGSARAYYRDREDGFNGEGYSTAQDVEQYGGAVNFKVGEKTEFRAEYDATDTAGNTTERVAADVRQQLPEGFSIAAGVQHESDDVRGDLTDVGGELRYNSRKDWQTYAFGQVTVDRDDSRESNSRAGLGLQAPVTDRIKLGGEVHVDDDAELGARLSADYRHSDQTNYYLAYELTPDRTNTGTGFNGLLSNRGNLAFGGRTRLSDALSVYGEEQLYHFGSGVDGLTHTYGVDYTPAPAWRLGASVENGDVDNLERLAVAANVGYDSDNGAHVDVAAEFRDEEDDTGAVDRKTYVGRLNAGYQWNDDLRSNIKANTAFSEGNQQNVENGDFVEVSAGLAYRPTHNDKLNALVRYHTFYDLATDAQIATGAAADYKQKSHIFAADVNYDINEHFTVGAKYGYKFGSIKLPNTGRYVDSTVHLGVLRGDFHIVKAWDALIEGRVLYQEEIDALNEGILLGVYRHIGDHIKVGAGYNFSEFSDDLTNVNYDNHGWFINVISKF